MRSQRRRSISISRLQSHRRASHSTRPLHLIQVARSRVTPGTSGMVRRGPGFSAAHTYTQAGTYTVTLTLTDQAANHASTSHTVRIDDPAIIRAPDLWRPGRLRVTAFARCQLRRLHRDARHAAVPRPGSRPGQPPLRLGLPRGWIQQRAVRVKADDASGAINNLRPGDTGYVRAALARAAIVFPSGSDASTPDVQIVRQALTRFERIRRANRDNLSTAERIQLTGKL